MSGSPSTVARSLATLDIKLLLDVVRRECPRQGFLALRLGHPWFNFQTIVCWASNPAVVRVQTPRRAEEILYICNRHDWKVIVGVEPDEPENIADV